MTIYQTSAELKNTARIRLEGKYGTSILAAITPTLSSFLAGFPFLLMFEVFLTLKSVAANTPFDDTTMTVATEIITLVCALFGGVFRAGLALYFLNIACGKRYSLSDLFFGFRWQFKKSLILSAVFLVITEICFLPQTLINFDIIPISGNEKFLATFAFSLISTILQILVTLPISQAFYLMLDFPQYSAMELLQHSIRMMKGRNTAYLRLIISFIPLELLCILSCYIGYLWLMPYQQMAYANFFLDTMNPRKQESSGNVI